MIIKFHFVDMMHAFVIKCIRTIRYFMARSKIIFTIFSHVFLLQNLHTMV